MGDSSAGPSDAQPALTDVHAVRRRPLSRQRPVCGPARRAGQLATEHLPSLLQIAQNGTLGPPCAQATLERLVELLWAQARGGSRR
eukprot:3514343-Pyramimonas_sp.AAC.1